MSRECITEEELADYLEGRLPDPARARVEEHLDRCERCFVAASMANGVVRGADLSAYEPAPDEVTSRAIRTAKGTRKGKLFGRAARELAEAVTGEVNDLLGRFSWNPLAPQAVRGYKKKLSEDMVVVRKRYASGSFEIQFEKRRNHVCISVKTEEHPGPGRVRATLLRENREVASHLIDGSTCQFDEIPFSDYTLQFKKNGEYIGEYQFDLREKSHAR